MTVLVTGGTGFLGRRLVRLLREDGLHVRCLVRPTSDVESLKTHVGTALWAGVDVRPVSLMDVERCRDALLECDVVYHLAAGLSGGTSTLFLDSVVTTRRLIEASLRAHVKRFVLVSSLGVYGAASLKSGSLLDETTPVDPHPHLRDAYSYSKIVQEQAAFTACRERGLPLVVVRPGVIIGPGRGALSGRIGLQLGPLMVRMGGGQTLPYVYVDNCAAAIRQAGLIPGIEGEAFNVLDDDLPTGKRILRMYRQVGQRRRWVWVPRPLIQPLAGIYEWYHHASRGQLPGVITRYKTASMWKKLKYTNQKAKDRLQWTPEIPFEEAFRRSIAIEA